MRPIHRGVLQFVFFMILAFGTVPSAIAERAERVLFRIVMLEQHEGKQEILSDAVIDGPPGTDFTIKLSFAKFHMDARFLTDLAGKDKVTIKAVLDIRRLYGYSERKLPLYEEDHQQQTLPIHFDEQLVLLPFGRKDDNEQLKIVIVPAIGNPNGPLPDGKPQPLEIKIQKQSVGGAIAVEAFKTPHRFDVEASLLENGKKISSVRDAVSIEEGQDLLLSFPPKADVALDPIAVKLTVESYRRSRPMDSVFFRFDVDRLARNGGHRSPVASNWSGSANPGRETTYDLTPQIKGPAGRKYELRISIKPAKGESLE